MCSFGTKIRGWHLLTECQITQNYQIGIYNLELAILLFLTSVGRCHEICYLNIKFMVRTSSSFKFFFTKVTKSWRKGKPIPCLEFHEYSGDEKYCV